MRILISNGPAFVSNGFPMPTISEVEVETTVMQFVVPMQVTPLTIASELATKFSPVTLICADPPANTAGGFNESMCGIGVAFGVMVNVTCEDVPPPGCVVKTTTVAVPGF